jgi:4-amino-4-deoxy-L-arabinose transferase-like glycosyltransferase
LSKNPLADARGTEPSLPFGLLLFAIAFVPRLYVALAWAGEPVWDGHYYDFGARRIAQGMGYSDDLTIDGLLVWHPWCHYPVGYSAFLGAFYRVFGASTHVAAVVNATVGALLAVVTWALARHALSPLRARVAGLLVAAHPGLILYSALVMTEPLAALLTLAAFWIAVRDEKPMRGIALAALTLGVGALVRPQALLCAPFLVLVHKPFVSWRLRVSSLVVAGVAACALALVPVLPWTARNCRVMDGCALVSTNAGWNLAIGAFPRATGRFETLRSSDGCAEVTGQVQQDRCWLDYGVSQIKASPGRWLGLIPAKLGFTFDHESFAVEYLHEARPDAWPESRRAFLRNVMTVFHLALVAGAALGCIAYRPRVAGESRRKYEAGAAAQGALLLIVAILFYVAVSDGHRTFWPLAVFAAIAPWIPFPGRSSWPPALLLPIALLGTTTLTHAIFFGEDRYHMVVSPVLCLLAACALRKSETQAARAT